jgi:hypothetical protein
MQALDSYGSLLATEAERDMRVFHTPWVVYMVVPLTLYILYAVLKWYILLMPITMPLTLITGARSERLNRAIFKKN